MLLVQNIVSAVLFALWVSSSRPSPCPCSWWAVCLYILRSILCQPWATQIFIKALGFVAKMLHRGLIFQVTFALYNFTFVENIISNIAHITGNSLTWINFNPKCFTSITDTVKLLHSATIHQKKKKKRQLNRKRCWFECSSWFYVHSSVPKLNSAS